MFALTLTDTKWRWFKLIINNIPEKKKIMRRFNSYGENPREQYTYLHNMKFDHKKT